MPSSRPASSRRLVRPATVLGGLALLVVGLALLAIPFLKAPAHAASARTDLEAASPQVATYRNDALETSEVFEIVARP